MEKQIQYTRPMKLHSAYLYLLLKEASEHNRQSLKTKEAVLKIIAYNFGYSKPASPASLDKWLEMLESAINNGVPFGRVLVDEQRGPCQGKQYE